eukprot:181502_1
MFAFQNCSDGKLVVLFIYILVSFICFITAVLGTIRYLMYYKHHPTERPPKTLFIVGLLHLSISLCALASYLANSIQKTITCGAWFWSLFYIFMGFHSLQTYFLWIVLFLRVYYTFMDSVYTISRWTIYFFSLIFIAAAIAALLVMIPIFESSIQWIFTFTLLVLMVVMSFAISALFIYKLHCVYKSMIDAIQDDGLLSIITKNTILVLLSISFSIGSLLSTVLTLYQWGWAISRIRNFIFLFDAYTNFICIILTYKFFDKYYHNICGCVDTKCKIFCHCCTKLITKKKRKKAKKIEIGNISNDVIPVGNNTPSISTNTNVSVNMHTVTL